MQGVGKLHCDGLPLVSEPRAQPSLSPPHRGGPCATSHEANSQRFATGYTQKQLLSGNSWCWWVVGGGADVVWMRCPHPYPVTRPRPCGHDPLGRVHVHTAPKSLPLTPAMA